MKIAILTPTFSYYSGIDRVVELQAKNFSKKDEVTVFALEAGLKPENFKLVVLGMPKNPFFQRLYRLFFFLDFSKIKSAAEKLKDFDIVISHFYPMNLIASYAKKKYNAEYIYHNHGVGYSKLFNNPLERLYIWLFAFFNKLSLKNADSVVSISRFLQQELKKETGLDSKIVYDKIDKSRFKIGIDGKRIRKRLKIKENEKLLLFVGRLSPHKNVHNLLKMFEIISTINHNIKLIIIGRPTFKSYYNRLKKAANKNVIFKEFVDDKELPHYYAACDLYVTASLWEGFNLPIAEAQACGKKVVAFDVCSHPEVVIDGILVKKYDYKGFANAIIKLLK
ncbi:glycosyltransferase family 4 protein [Candidatus Woesearchaeota archaeon]|nr:glycosyltransferase family 4 protein [Candidatus Woesearchaeota archaeon]